VAELLGKESAVFLPSGTMCNEIAIHVHCRPGEEVICDETAHIVIAEAGGPAALSGVMVNPIRGKRGIYTGEQLRTAVRTESRYAPRSRLVEVEQTSNLGGGSVWPLATIQDVAKTARSLGLKLHMDGARLFNAVVASGVPAAAYAEPFDTVWVDFTKGLGAPLGAVLAGTTDFIGEAWRWKQRLGGSMRQGGMNAAACIWALDHHIDRLAEDHANAASLARGMAQIPGITVETPETNLVFFDTQGTGMTAAAFAAKLRQAGVMVSVSGTWRGRACLHLDVTASMVEEALAAMRQAV